MDPNLHYLLVDKLVERHGLPDDVNKAIAEHRYCISHNDPLTHVDPRFLVTLALASCVWLQV